MVDMVFLVFYRVFVSTTGLESFSFNYFFEARKVPQKIFFWWWSCTFFSSLHFTETARRGRAQCCPRIAPTLLMWTFGNTLTLPDSRSCQEINVRNVPGEGVLLIRLPSATCTTRRTEHDGLTRVHALVSWPADGAAFPWPAAFTHLVKLLAASAFATSAPAHAYKVYCPHRQKSGKKRAHKLKKIPGTPGGTNRGQPAGVPGISCCLL